MALGIWVPDKESSSCMKCHDPFTLTNRRHHCRRCGLLYCKKCCWAQAKLDGSMQKVRVCNTCKCHVFRLTDAILQYVFGAFLNEKDQCRVLRICHRFTGLAILPFKMLTGPLSLRFRPPKGSGMSNVGTGLGRHAKFTNRTPTVMVDSDTGCLNTLRIVDKAGVFSRRQWRELQKEIAILQQCSHPLFVDLYEILQTRHRVVLVQEQLDGKYLTDFLHPRKKSGGSGSGRAVFDDAVSSSVCRQILQGLNYLHEQLNGAVGRIQADTVFITRDGVVKLTDLSNGAMKPQGEFDRLRESNGLFGCLTPSVRSRSGSESPGLSESFCSAIGNTYAHSPISAAAALAPPAHHCGMRPHSGSLMGGGPAGRGQNDSVMSSATAATTYERQEGVTRLTVGSCDVLLFDRNMSSRTSSAGGSSTDLAGGDKGGRGRKPLPAPLQIPGGVDDVLLRRSTLFTRAADERKFNLSLPFTDNMLRTLIAPRLPEPTPLMKALDIRQCGLLLHDMLTGNTFRKTSAAIRDWEGLSEQARLAVSLMTAEPEEDAPLTPQLLLKTCDFFLDPENFMPLETLFD